MKEFLQAIDYNRRLELIESPCKPFAIPREAYIESFSQCSGPRLLRGRVFWLSSTWENKNKIDLCYHRNGVTTGWKRAVKASRDTTRRNDSRFWRMTWQRTSGWISISHLVNWRWNWKRCWNVPWDYKVKRSRCTFQTNWKAGKRLWSTPKTRCYYQSRSQYRKCPDSARRRHLVDLKTFLKIPESRVRFQGAWAWLWACTEDLSEQINLNKKQWLFFLNLISIYTSKCKLKISDWADWKKKLFQN